MDLIQDKIASASQALTPLLEQGRKFSKENPLQAAGIAGAGLLASYGVSWLVSHIRNPSPNVRMVSITKDARDATAAQRPLLVFIHGWPDIADSWGNQINELYSEYDCLLIELPNTNFHCNNLKFLFGDNPQTSTKHARKPREYPTDCEILYHISNNHKGIITSNINGDKVPSNAYNTNNWGWTLATVTDSIIHAIGNYVEKYRNGNKNLSLIIHDWGSLYGYSIYKTLKKEINGWKKQKQKFVIDRIAAIDVGDTVEIKTFTQIAILCGYQWYNAVAFLVPLPQIGYWMTYGELKAIFRVAPLIVQGRMRSLLDRRINYPYFWTWIEVFNSKLFQLLGINRVVRPKKGEIPDVPFYFSYPENDPNKLSLKFHTKKWQMEIERRNAIAEYKGCYVYQPFPKTFHWIHYESRSTQQYTQILKEWLSHTDGKRIEFTE